MEAADSWLVAPVLPPPRLNITARIAEGDTGYPRWNAALSALGAGISTWRRWMGWRMGRAWASRGLKGRTITLLGVSSWNDCGEVTVSRTFVGEFEVLTPSARNR